MRKNTKHLIPLAGFLVLAPGTVGCGDGRTDWGADQPGHSSESVVFGSDDRLEFGAVTDPQWLRIAQATGSMFVSGGVSCAGGSCDLSTSQFLSARTGSFSVDPLCTDEPLRGQEHGAYCTVFLVGPDLFATAGHCLCTKNTGPCACNGKSVVFGFTADANGNNEVTTVPGEDVYSCTGTPTGVYTDTEDWAFFHVDRVVSDRVPLIARYSGSVADNRELLVAGYPDGLPLKLADNGYVKENSPSDPVNFATSLDAFAGNSGSPVVDLESGVVQGIHVRRPYWHYNAVSDGNGGTCAATNVCSTATGCNPNFGTSAWAQATRMEWAAGEAELPLHAALVSAVL